ncbi:DUF3710 domain-containing protein [Streptomyces sp. NPDC051079]|uniref:DUF3710 domain-containing protein n=1 Tax=Streptomyces sp. NPDC051079 TaxID=3155043 RepID=UPI0034505A6E
MSDGKVRDDAQAVLKQFAADGYLAPMSASRAEWGAWGRVTPAWVVLVGLKALLRLRWEGGDQQDAALELSGLLPGVSSEDAAQLVEAMLGDLAAARRVVERELLTLERLVRLMHAVTEAEAMTDDEVKTVLEFAEETCRDALELDGPALTRGRGVDSGPWDVEEAHRAAGRRKDLGGLRVLVDEGTQIHPMRAGGHVVAVTLVRGRTAIQLQVFSSPPETWDSIRAQMLRTLRDQGGAAGEWVGAAGVEIRAVSSMTSSSGSRSRKDLRVLGCDGPGWVLRGIVSGAGAAQDSRDDWAYRTFSETMVSLGDAAGRGGVAVRLRWPVSGA